MTSIRLSVGGLGFLGGLYGAYLLLTRQQGTQLVSAVEWLVGAVLLNDVLIATFSLVVGAAAGRALPAVWARRPVLVGLIVLGTVSLVGFPMIGRFGEISDNPTLLNRHYTIGWLVFAAIVVVGVAVGLVLSRRHALAAPSSDASVPAGGE